MRQYSGPMPAARSACSPWPDARVRVLKKLAVDPVATERVSARNSLQTPKKQGIFTISAHILLSESELEV